HIGISHRVEHLVAEIGVKTFVIIAQGIDQPRAVSVPVNAVQYLALLLRAVEDLGEDGVVAAQDAALKIILLPREVAHPVCRGSILTAISRIRLTSAISSSSGGMLSSRSIMVETRPKRLSAAA